ncbi:PadR family transcriptional regulator [Wukongibacter baidiensis]|uniref:PadR family transcriptional regulator n=1 Tax=Wukongibacter baidiensis TaxID=1723361 RepID=UPI003D7FA262
MARQQLQNLTEPMYYILLTLTTPNHGYAIMKRVAEMTKERVRVGAGTLYSLLSRFEKEGIVHCVDNEGKRKIYKITDKGMELLLTEHRRLINLVEDGNKVLKGDKNG